MNPRMVSIDCASMYMYIALARLPSCNIACYLPYIQLFWQMKILVDFGNIYELF